MACFSWKKWKKVQGKGCKPMITGKKYMFSPVDDLIF
jgi:hypothetical protein